MSQAVIGVGLRHPLDPLNKQEVLQARKVCKNHASKLGISPLRFNTITLKEPPKSSILKYNRSGSVPPRQAFCIVQSPRDRKAFEATVALEPDAEVSEWVELGEGVQPLASPDDCFLAEEIIKQDPEIAKLVQERYGLNDLSQLVIDPWSVHSENIDGRQLQIFLYKASFPDDNAYAHPLDIVPIVDLNQKKVAKIDIPETVTPIPEKNVNYHRKHLEVPFRQDLKPLNIVQPEGPSFKIEGNKLEWQKWSMRIGFNYREGLVLHEVGYQESPDAPIRPVLHRASLVEMCVPYGDTRSPFVRKCAFDVGDYGLGNCANSLELGCDCLGHIQYLDAVLNDSKGEPWEIKKAICIHEEDRGLLWKHMDYRTGYAESRRSRVLTLSFIATVVNYEYLFYWYFYQDGTIEYEIKLSGELSTNVLSPGEVKPDFGTLVSPNVNAQYHQHMFCARLDVAVDDAEGGKGLQVKEVDVEALPEDPDSNPSGNGFKTVETILTSEQQAQRVANAHKGRIWKIANPNKTNQVTGDPVAYNLVPAAGAPMLAKNNSLIAKKGRFAQKDLWVTPYDDKQKWPAGDYPMQSSGEMGLPEWTKQDRSLVDEDIVLWHTFGVTHIPRPEDFPVMPVEKVGFTLKPFGFFDMNPAVDVPPSVNEASKEVCCNQNGHIQPEASSNGHAS
eukprot:TRINITY_DN3179_c0_g5_i1.p1 TRINITY_DN3179_c0_g5~~TRINITY_DN3179_c0_g5_i1.p1  ORF type:complete len:672 (-),score=75.87 TRINITY_DN3179_c0_g5_i1:433-2448(-)